MNTGTPKQVTMALTIQFYPLASQHEAMSVTTVDVQIPLQE